MPACAKRQGAKDTHEGALSGLVAAAALGVLGQEPMLYRLS